VPLLTTAPATASVARVERAVPRAPAGVLDEESRGWLADLRSDGRRRDEAIDRLHELLLRAARFEVSRRRQALQFVRDGDLDDIATQAANDALIALLGRLDDFRGDSRFTTWAYKFALLHAASKLRRRAWQERELPLDHDSLASIRQEGHGPDDDAETAEVLGAIGDGMEELTPHQRTVITALALNGVPIDVLAERLDTNRNALYKTLHDARKKLRQHLDECGLTWKGDHQ
jgi:RNA polymerase sigma-70 factor, ECF subfamily